MLINIRCLIVIEDLIFEQIKFILEKPHSALALLIGKTFNNPGMIFSSTSAGIILGLPRNSLNEVTISLSKC